MKYLVSLVILLLAQIAMAQETTYRYEGSNYTTTTFAPNCPSGLTCKQYSTSMKISGTVTLNAPLEPNLSSVSVGDRIVRFNFTDGINTYRSGDAGSGIFDFTVSTDALGQIKTSPFLYFSAYRFADGTAQVTSPERMSFMQIGPSGNGMLQDALNDGECLPNGNGGCGTLVVDAPGSAYASVNEAGTWTRVAAPSIGTTASIPTLSEWAMIFMAMVMAMFAARRLRRR